MGEEKEMWSFTSSFLLFFAQLKSGGNNLSPDFHPPCALPHKQSVSEQWELKSPLCKEGVGIKVHYSQPF